MPTVILFWVWFCAYLNCAGWTLSALHQLNTGGYLVALLPGLVAFVVWRKQDDHGDSFAESGVKYLPDVWTRPARHLDRFTPFNGIQAD